MFILILINYKLLKNIESVFKMAKYIKRIGTKALKFDFNIHIIKAELNM